MTIRTAHKIDYKALEYTGVKVTLRLDTSPVTLDDAEAFIGFINRTLTTLLEAWESHLGQPLGLVPVIEINTGSIEAIVRFMREKKDAATELAANVTKEIAKEILMVLIWSTLGLTTGGEHSSPPPNTPKVVQQSAHSQIQPDLNVLYNALKDSGKPFKVEISDGEILIQGNQPEPPAPPKHEGKIDF